MEKIFFFLSGVALLYHCIDNIDILHDYNELVLSFLRVIKISPYLKEHLWQEETFSGCYRVEDNQLTFTSSKPTVETLEKGVKYVQSNNKNTWTMSMRSFWCFYC